MKLFYPNSAGTPRRRYPLTRAQRVALQKRVNPLAYVSVSFKNPNLFAFAGNSPTAPQNAKPPKWKPILNRHLVHLGPLKHIDRGIWK